MNLTNPQAKKICDSYNLGKLISYKPVTEGYVNYSFIFTTDKGKFIVQVFGIEFNKWKKRRIKLQFKVLEFLKKNKFPYKIPEPVKNKNKSYFMNYKKRKLWVYPYIEGDSKKRLTKNEFQELAKAVAVFHKYIAPLKDQGDKDYFNFDWILGEYENLKKIKPKSKLDKLMQENIDFFMNVIKKIKALNPGKMILNHSDFKNNNVLFKGRKIVGIIDFDNIKAAPIAGEIGTALMRSDYLEREFSKKKLKIFLEEYERIIPLSKKEKELIIPVILKEYSMVFMWFYNGMEKHRDRAYMHMQETIDKTKRLLRIWGK